MDTMLNKSGLSIEELTMVQGEMLTKKKSKGTAYILWFFTGGFGGHRFYMGDIGYAVGMLLVNWMTLGIWALIDLFLIGGRIDAINTETEMGAIEKVKMYSKAQKENAK